MTSFLIAARFQWLLFLAAACSGISNAPTPQHTPDGGPDASAPEDGCIAVLGAPCDSIATTYVKASNSGYDDFFGGSVALDGDFLVVGARREDSKSTGVDGDQNNEEADAAGAVYVFHRTAGVWAQEAYLKASNASADEYFGISVALSGDVVVVGALPSAMYTGAAYVFRRTAAGWAQEAILTASNPDEGDEFGLHVAIDGDTIAVTAVSEASAATGIAGDQGNNTADYSGAVYIFRGNGVDWTQEAYIKASNTDAGDSFGDSVALQGDTLVIGAPYEASGAKGVNGDQLSNSVAGAGAAYIFHRTGTNWTQEAYLKASNPDAKDIFGTAVAIDGDTLVVGAAFESSGAIGVNGAQSNNDTWHSGAVYVFIRQADSWAQQAYIKASNTGYNDSFGSTLALQGDTLVVGAPVEDSARTSINGQESGPDDGAYNSGAVYLFHRSASSWKQVGYVKASNTDSEDYFGAAVALDDMTLVIGAPGEDGAATSINGSQSNNARQDAGAAYVYAAP